MYGQDQLVESMLGNIESLVAPVFAKMASPSDDIVFNASTKLTLAVFLVTLGARTQFSEQQLADFLGWYDIGAFERDIGDFGEVVPSPSRERSIGPAEIVASASIFYPMLLDLDFVLLVNETESEFVTSDHPVVRYNQLMEFDRDGGSHCGWAWKGLQVFLPVSPQVCLLLYDASVYRLSGRNGAKYRVSSVGDVQQVNTLQATSAQSAMYFFENGESCLLAAKRARRYRAPHTSSAVRFRSADRSEFLRVSNADVRTDLSLSFLSLRESAKHWRRSLLLSKRRELMYVRNPDLANEHREFADLVRAGKYGAGDFFKFRRDGGRADSI